MTRCNRRVLARQAVTGDACLPQRLGVAFGLQTLQPGGYRNAAEDGIRRLLSEKESRCHREQAAEKESDHEVAWTRPNSGVVAVAATFRKRPAAPKNAGNMSIICCCINRYATNHPRISPGTGVVSVFYAPGSRIRPSAAQNAVPGQRHDRCLSAKSR